MARTIEEFAKEQKFSIYGAFEEAWRWKNKRDPSTRDCDEIKKHFNSYRASRLRPKPQYVTEFEAFLAKPNPGTMPEAAMRAINRHFRT